MFDPISVDSTLHKRKDTLEFAAKIGQCNARNKQIPLHSPPLRHFPPPNNDDDKKAFRAPIYDVLRIMKRWSSAKAHSGVDWWQMSVWGWEGWGVVSKLSQKLSQTRFLKYLGQTWERGGGMSNLFQALIFIATAAAGLEGTCLIVRSISPL